LPAERGLVRVLAEGRKEGVTGAALAHPVSRQWAGYWQRAQKAA